MLQCHLNRSSLHGFRNFCTSKDLSTKKCVPCNLKDLQPMTEHAAYNLIPQVAGWNLVHEGGTLKLNQSWKVKSFTKGLELFKIVVDVAEAEGHHPYLQLVEWNNVTIEICTHALELDAMLDLYGVLRLTENDFILAAKINGLDVQHLLGWKPAD